MAAQEYHQKYALTHYLPPHSSGDMGVEIESK